MSWLLGRNRPQPPGSSDLGTLPAGDDDHRSNKGDDRDVPSLTKAERKAMEAYRFDSSALERAAEAARTLERSSIIKLNEF